MDRLLAELGELGLELDEQQLREKVIDLHAQAREHDVSADDVRRRNLLRELFGGSAKP